MDKRSNFSSLAAGANMQYSQCPPGSVNSACQAAFLGIHLTSGSSAYLEVQGLEAQITYSNLIFSHRAHGSGPPTTTLILPAPLKFRSLLVAGFFPSLMAQCGLLAYARGFCDSPSPNWDIVAMLIKAAERTGLYQYRLVNAQNRCIGLAQTETV